MDAWLPGAYYALKVASWATFEEVRQMMRVRNWVGFAAALVVLARPTLAFDEQSVHGRSDAPPVSLDGSSIASKPGASGPSLELPGLGNLGVIPKLDFGLELLYGDRNTAAAITEPDTAPEDDSLRVRGTIRHRF